MASLEKHKRKQKMPHLKYRLAGHASTNITSVYISIDDLDVGIEYIFSEFEDDNELGVSIDLFKG